MINIKHFLILGVFFGLVACSNPSQPQFAAASAAADFRMVSDKDATQSQGIPISLNLDGKLELRFQVEDLFTEEAYLQQIHHDTVYLMLGFVEKISGHQFHIQLQDPEIKNVSVYQSYQTSLSLMDEGPHMDFTDWIHYTSKWEAIPVVNGQFSSLEYQKDHYQRFPEVSKEEIVEAVRSRVNDDKWLELAQKCEDPRSYPCGVSISRYFLKLEIQDAQNEISQRIVVFEVPMGC